MHGEKLIQFAIPLKESCILIACVKLRSKCLYCVTHMVNATSFLASTPIFGNNFFMLCYFWGLRKSDSIVDNLVVILECALRIVIRQNQERKR